MSFKIAQPIVKEFILSETDKEFGNDDAENPTKVSIKQAAQGEHATRMDLWKEFKRQYDGDQLQVVQSISPASVQRKEVFLTMTACNILDENDTELFKFPLKETEFIKAWNKLPVTVANEIHSKVLEANPIWAGASGEEDI